MQHADLKHRFAFHSAADDKAKQNAHALVRQACFVAATHIDVHAPDGREKSTAITKLEEAMFWANAAIARGTEVKF